MSTDTTTTAPPAVPPAVTRPQAASSWAALSTLARAMLRSFFRDRAALFFTFFFPLMFLVVFGLLFRSDSNPVKIGVVGNGPIVRSLPTDVFTVQRFDSLDDAVAKVKSGDLPAAVAQDGDTVVLRYAASDQIKSATVVDIVNSAIARANVAATGQQARFDADFRQVEAADTRPIQYITPTILSWGVATSAVFGAALTLVTWRKKHLLRRVRLSPAPAWTVVGARVGVSLVVSLVQAAVYIGVALTPPFGLKLSDQWWLAIPFLLVGTLSCLSIGLLVGAVAKTEEAAQAMANFVVLPMAFLSGTFFDISQAPAWLQAVSKVLPLRHINDGMLDVLVRGEGIDALLLPGAVLLGVALVLAFVATRVFQWDDV